MFLFILEQIGTQEIILIAGLALIIFGPRKLPEIVKTIGKTIAQFKNATNEFKSTWEKEVAFEDDLKVAEKKTPSTTANSIARDIRNEDTDSTISLAGTPPSPEIKELSSEEVARIFQKEELQAEDSTVKETVPESYLPAKRDWL